MLGEPRGPRKAAERPTGVRPLLVDEGLSTRGGGVDILGRMNS